MRSKSVDFNSWLELQMWRSDGAPAAHGTFALIAVNLKLKKGLLQQGHYALNTSGIDVSTTAQEILQAADEDVLQKQMTELIKRYTYMSCFEYMASTRTKQLTTFLITKQVQSHPKEHTRHQRVLEVCLSQVRGFVPAAVAHT